jgi:cytochrome c-type biogenesis protein
MLSNIERVLTVSPFLAIFVVFWAGALASLSSCSLVRIPIVFGLVAGTSDSKKKSILSLLFFILGLVFSYTLLGVFLTILGDFTSRLIPATRYLYTAFGILLVFVGILVVGLFKIKSLHFHFDISNKFKKTGYFGAFLFGIGLAFLEMPTCPCCAPVLLVIAGSVVLKSSYLYSIIIFISFALGQSLPSLVIGTSTGLVKYLTPRISKFEGYIRLVAGNILIVFGIYLVLIA